MALQMKHDCLEIVLFYLGTTLIKHNFKVFYVTQIGPIKLIHITKK